MSALVGFIICEQDYTSVDSVCGCGCTTGEAERALGRRGGPRRCQRAAEGGCAVAGQIPTALYRQAQALAGNPPIRTARYLSIYLPTQCRDRPSTSTILIIQIWQIFQKNEIKTPHCQWDDVTIIVKYYRLDIINNYYRMDLSLFF